MNENTHTHTLGNIPKGEDDMSWNDVKLCSDVMASRGPTHPRRRCWSTTCTRMPQRRWGNSSFLPWFGGAYGLKDQYILKDISVLLHDIPIISHSRTGLFNHTLECCDVRKTGKPWFYRRDETWGIQSNILCLRTHSYIYTRTHTHVYMYIYIHIYIYIYLYV